MVDTSRDLAFGVPCASVPAYFTGSRFLWLSLWHWKVAAHLATERASYERCFEYTNWEKRSQLITLKCRLFTIKVIQICTVESVFMMRTHNLVEHRASRVNVFFWKTFALDAAHVTLPMRRGPLRGWICWGRGPSNKMIFSIHLVSSKPTRLQHKRLLEAYYMLINRRRLIWRTDCCCCPCLRLVGSVLSTVSYLWWSSCQCQRPNCNPSARQLLASKRLHHASCYFSYSGWASQA